MGYKKLGVYTTALWAGLLVYCFHCFAALDHFNLGDKRFAYEMSAPIGKGADSSVYVATEVSKGWCNNRLLEGPQKLVIKLATNQANLAREIEAIEKNIEKDREFLKYIPHPRGIVRTSLGLAMAMEFIEYARSLHILLEAGPLPEMQVAQVFIPLVRGLGILHKNGYVHCDVKPKNILVKPLLYRPEVRIIDFGFTRTKAEIDHHIKNYRIFGTPAYLSPDVFMGDHDERADLWAVVVSIYQALTKSFVYLTESGNADMRIEDLNNIHHLFLNGLYSIPIPDYLSPPMKRLLRIGFDPDIEKRYQSAIGLEDDLREVLRYWSNKKGESR
ncbi:MAG: serine/threonine protein kinase [Bacteriovoracia bacterium]